MSIPTRRRGATKSEPDLEGAQNAPLRECVREAIDTYLRQLDGVETSDLYAMVMREVEAPMLEAVLQHTRGNQSKAAQILGMNRGTLRKKLRLYGLE
jgi:Fis family transcriptional regulator